MKFYTLFTICLVAFYCTPQALGQGDVFQTFRHTRVINSHSVETLPARKLDFRIVHRFGDIAGDAGGWTTFYGLENASDILIGLEYGLTDKAMIGLSRTKGSGPLKQNLNGLFKIRLFSQQNDGSIPFSLTALALTSYSTMQKSEIEGVLNFFEKNSHRLTYHLGVHLARRLSDRLSLQANFGWTYRNVVPSNDQNDLASIGAGLRLQATKALAIILDSTFPVFSELRNTDNGYYPSLGVGLEFDTSGGHVFQLNVTNSTGVSETDYIPYTRSNWGDGQYRLGFTISRLFNL